MYRRFVQFLVCAATVVSAEGIGAVTPGIPQDAHELIERVHNAASKMDYATLRTLMAREFQWSFGGDEDADQALEAWKKDAKYLRNLKRVTSERCAFITRELIECPASAGVHFRAGFEKTRSGWRMRYFVAGD